MPEPDFELLIELEDSLALVFDAQTAVLKGKRAKPSKEELRRLNKLWLQLEAEKADLENQIAAVEDGESMPSPPTPEVVEEIARLTQAAEIETRSNRKASEYLAFAGNVLDLATRVTA